jgi:hypothetical protein
MSKWDVMVLHRRVGCTYNFSTILRQSYSGELTYIYPNPMLTLAADRLQSSPSEVATTTLSTLPHLHLSQQHRHTSTKPVTAVKVGQEDRKRGHSHSDGQGLVNNSIHAHHAV